MNIDSFVNNAVNKTREFYEFTTSLTTVLHMITFLGFSIIVFLCLTIYYYYYYYYLKRLAMQCREREIATLSVRTPQPHTTNL